MPFTVPAGSRLTLYCRARGDRRGAARPARRGARAARGTGARAASSASSSSAVADRRRRWPRPSGSPRPTTGPTGALSYLWHQLSGGGAVGSTDHLTQLSTNLRSRWWGEAWDAFRDQPLRGNGADTFETIDRLARPDFQQAGQEHSAAPARALRARDPGRDPGADRAGRGRHLPGLGHAPARAGALRGARARGRRRRLRAAQPDRLGVEADRADAAGLPAAGARRLRRGRAPSRARRAGASPSWPPSSSRSP